MRLAHHDVNTKGYFTFFGIQHAAQFAQRLAKSACDACDHGIGLIHLQQQSAKYITVAVDHALDITPQVAASL